MNRATPRLLPASRGGGPRVAWWRGAGSTSPPRSAGRGTTRSVVEGRRPHDPYPSTILRMVPLPIRCANREETGTATNPPIVSISRAANPLIPLTFQKSQRHKPSAPGPVSDSSHPVGGEGVGSSAPMSAGCGRAMKPGGRIPRGSLRRSMDGLRLLAARFLCGPLSHVRRASLAAMSAAVIR